jgi:probable metal-binding protein
MSDAAKTFHGHEVMRMMLEAERAFSREELVAAIQERFGRDATFFTCSAEGLDAEGIVSFLEARGKFVGRPGEYGMSPDKICNH